MRRLVRNIYCSRFVLFNTTMFLLFVMFLRFYERHIGEDSEKRKMDQDDSLTLTTEDLLDAWNLSQYKSVFTDLFQESCTMKDPQCLSKLLRQFLSVINAGGLSTYGLQSLDPFIIKRIDFVITDGLTIILEDVTVTGFNGTEMSSYLFKMEEEIVSISLNLKHNLRVVSAASVNLQEASKVFTGMYVIDINATTKVEFPYEIARLKSGASYFYLGHQNGPLNIECAMASEPMFQMSASLHEAFQGDPDLKRKTDTLGNNREELRKKTTCEIINRAVTVLIQNFRTAASIMNGMLSTMYFRDS